MGTCRKGTAYVINVIFTKMWLVVYVLIDAHPPLVQWGGAGLRCMRIRDQVDMSLLTKCCLL